MIAKIITGSFYLGVLRYCGDQRDRDKQPEMLSKNVYGNDPVTIANEMKFLSDQHTRSKKKLKHIAISFAEEDKKLTSEQMEKIGQDYLKQMGYENNQHVMYRHHDGKQHFHIIVNRVDFNGNIVNDSYDKKKSMNIERFIEQKYGLAQKDMRIKQEKRVTAREYRMQEKGYKTNKETLKNILVNTLATSRSSQEYFKKLESYGVSCIFNKSKTTGYISGVTYKIDNITFKASQIGKKFTYNGIIKYFHNFDILYNRKEGYIAENFNIANNTNSFAHIHHSDNFYLPEGMLLGITGSTVSRGKGRGEDDEFDTLGRKYKKKGKKSKGRSL